MVLMLIGDRAEIYTCRVTRPDVVRRATSAKGSQRQHRPASSFARRWIISVRGSTARGRPSRPLPSASPKPVARALPLRRPSAAPPRLRHAERRCAIGRVAAAPAGSGPTPGVRLRLQARSSANPVGRQHTPHYRHRPAPPHVGARRLRDQRLRGALCVPKVGGPGRQRLAEPPDPASHTRHHRPRLAALCLAYFRR